MSTTPYQFISRGNLFITPVAPSPVPYPSQSLTKPREYSLWVHGRIEEPAFQLDHARMPPSLYQEVRNDLVRYSPVEVTQSAFRRSNHSYVGVIDSKGTPYYFALDSRGMSVREMDVNDDVVWKTFDKLSTQEHATALRERREVSTSEMKAVDHELSEPKLFVAKGLRAFAHAWAGGGTKRERRSKGPKLVVAKEAKPQRQPSKAAQWRQKYPAGAVAKQYPKMKAIMQDDITKSAAAWIVGQLKAGKQVKHENGTHAYRSTKRDDRTGKQTVSHFTVISPHGVKTIHDSAEAAGAVAHGHTEIKKALPKSGTKEKPVKKTPSKKSSSKKVGAGGKARYNYPNEKKKGPAKSGGKKPGAKQVPLIVAADHDDSKHADPAELANQLGVSVRTLQHAARRMGCDGFSKYMRSHMKRFAAKHRLDPDYWGTLYERLHDMEPSKTS